MARGGIILAAVCLMVLSTASPGDCSYWDVGHRGFLPIVKNNDVCSSSGIRPLCHILNTASNPTTNDIGEAARTINATAIINTADESTIEDAFHYLAIATARIGYDQNPNAQRHHQPIRVPSSVAIPLLTLAAHLHRAPTVGYASLVLDNCIQTDDNEFKSYNDWTIQRTITNNYSAAAHRAEKGFYAAHCAVELALAPAIQKLTTISVMINQTKSTPLSVLQLHSIVELGLSSAYAIRQAIPQVRGMRHFFKSADFFHVLRPFLKAGDTFENGIIFTADDTVVNMTVVINSSLNISYNTVTYLRGPTGAMTSTLSALDSGIGITEAISSDVHLRQTMDDFKQFHPAAHARLIESLSRSPLREVAERCRVYQEDISNLQHDIVPICIQVIETYDDLVVAVAEFRVAHVDLISTYILHSVHHVSPVHITGTGGTPIVAYLCRAVIGTLKARLVTIHDRKLFNLASVSLPTICIAQCLLDYQIGGLSTASDYCSSVHTVATQFNVIMSANRPQQPLCDS